LKSVDLPTFGRPMMATVGKPAENWSGRVETDDIEESRLRVVGTVA
jgi:hypothetical protein